MLKKAFLVVACLGMLFMATGARASLLDRKTTMTFNQPVEVPGAVLPAGTYVFRVLDVAGSRNIVQVSNADDNAVMTTFIAIPDEKATPYDETHIGFAERPAGSVAAIHEWFYPGMNLGLEFPYR